MEPMVAKKPWQSRTLWFALLNAVIALSSSWVQGMIAANPEGYALVVSGVFAALRKITKGKIAIE